MINLLFTPVVKRFRERHPDIHLTLREGTGQAVENLVADGELEVGATVLPVAPDHGLAARAFGSHPIWVIGPPDAAWAGKTSLPLTALRDSRLLVPTDDFAMTRRLRQAFADAGMQPAIAAQSAHWDFLVAMASVGLGVALLPEPLMGRMKTRGLSTAKLAKSGLQWEVGHIWQQSGYLSYATRAWLEVCDEVLGRPKSGRPRHGEPPAAKREPLPDRPSLVRPARTRRRKMLTPTKRTGRLHHPLSHKRNRLAILLQPPAPALLCWPPGASRSSNPLCFRTPPAPDARRRSRASALLASLALAMALLLSGAWSAAAHAATPGTPAEIEADLASARKQIDDMRKRIANEADDANLQQLYGTAVDIQAKAEAAAETLAPQLASVAARLNSWARPGRQQGSADVAAQRLSLETSRRGLDAQIKLAKLLSVDAGQTAEQVSAQLRAQFKARLGERRDAFLSGQFWNEFKGELPRDLERLSTLRDDLYEAVQQTPAWGWLLLAGITALVIALRMGIGRALLRLTANRVPPGRLRRSALAAAQVALSTATPGLIAVLVHVGLDWNSQLSDSTSNLLAAMVITVFSAATPRGWAAPCCRPAIRPGACRPSAMPWRRG